MKRSSCFLLLYILLASCATAPAFTATKAPTKPLAFTNTPEAPTSTETPTMVPTSTETPDPMAGAPEGATGKNAKGEWIKAVIENGHTYEYTYSAELGQWVRKVGEFPLWDTPYENYMTYQSFITGSTLGEKSLLQIIHTDSVSDSDQSPLQSTFKPELEKRYYNLEKNGHASNEQSSSLQSEMMKGLESQAFLPITLSNGENAEVRLSTVTGIILTIMDKETLMDLGGKYVSTWHYGDTTFYIEVYGVDKAGNELARLAFDGSITDISSDVLRNILFTFPGNLVDHEDQSMQGFSNLAQGFALYSSKLRENGTQDVVIDRVPQAQP